MTFDSLLTELQHDLPKLLAALPVAALVVLSGLLANALTRRGLKLLAQRTRLTVDDIRPLERIARWAIMLLTGVLVLGVFGFELGGIWAMLSTILAMVAIGFVAVWSILSNISATILILLLRPFHIGDEVELQSENVKGRVVDLNFFFTTLQLDENTTHQVPNNLFFQKVVSRVRGEGAISLAAQLSADQPAVFNHRQVVSAAEDFAMKSVPDPATLSRGSK